MSGIDLSSRAVIGMFYQRLEQATGLPWIDALSMYFTSDQAMETYPWLGQVPVMREWVGGRRAKGFTSNKIEIRNKHFESTIEILKSDMRRDKTGQLRVRINEFADRPNSHWATLISTLIANGESTVCYDGQYFFDTDHAEGDSGSQSNDIGVDISALPVGDTTGAHVSVTAPSVGEMALSIQRGIRAILGFKDDRGEPMNEMASQFGVMVPNSLADVALAATALPLMAQGMSNPLPASSRRVTVWENTRLDIAGWTDKFAVFRTDGQAKPFIRQEEQALELKVKAEGSEFEFDNDAHQYGIDTWRNVGYGYWQHACLVTMT